MGKLKQQLPLGVSPDTNLFLAMFLIRLTPFMREAVGAGNHKTAMDTLWDAQGSHDLTVSAATTQRSRSPIPTGGKKNEKRNDNARSKSRPPSRLNFNSFHNTGNGVCKFHNYCTHKAHRCISPCAWSEN
jgi:hypothetical protein